MSALEPVYTCRRVLPLGRECGYVQRGPGVCPYDHPEPSERQELVPFTPGTDLGPYELREDGVYREFASMAESFAMRCANIASILPGYDEEAWDRATMAIRHARESSVPALPPTGSCDAGS